MHLGNGALTPECCLITWGAATVGLGMAASALRQEKLTADRALAAGGLTAAVFAVQMFNVQIMPQAVSGHFLGGVLLCWTLGASWGSLLMALVLFVQAVVLGDGGLSTWGANVINMALLPAGLVWAARRALSADSSALVRGLSLAGVSAAAVIGAATLVVAEVSMGRFDAIAGLESFARAMLMNHMAIAIAEAGLTVGLVALLSSGELAPVESTRASDRLRAAGALLLALVLVPLAIQFGSQLPDGYEAAVELSSLGNVLLATGSNGPLVSNEILAGWIGALIAGVFGGILALVMARREEAELAA